MNTFIQNTARCLNIKSKAQSRREEKYILFFNSHERSAYICKFAQFQFSLLSKAEHEPLFFHRFFIVSVLYVCPQLTQEMRKKNLYSSSSQAKSEGYLSFPDASIANFDEKGGFLCLSYVLLLRENFGFL